MACRIARVALIFAFAANVAIAAESDADSQEKAMPTAGVEQMTPAQLRALKSTLDRQIGATREANAAASRRIEELERRNAELDAKRAGVEAELSGLREQMARLEAVRKD